MVLFTTLSFYVLAQCGFVAVLSPCFCTLCPLTGIIAAAQHGRSAVFGCQLTMFLRATIIIEFSLIGRRQAAVWFSKRFLEHPVPPGTDLLESPSLIHYTIGITDASTVIRLGTGQCFGAPLGSLPVLPFSGLSCPDCKKFQRKDSNQRSLGYEPSEMTTSLLWGLSHGGWIRTSDFKVMSLARCPFSTPQCVYDIY